MKKKFLLMTMAIFAVVSMMAQTYYVAGDGSAAGGSWCDGKYWVADGSLMSGTPASVTFIGVPAGTYAFKVTDGTWTNSWGWPNIAPGSIVSGVNLNGTNNIGFTIGGTADITITYDGTNISLSSSIGFGELVITSYTVVGDAGLCGEPNAPTATENDMTQNGDIWTKIFTGIAAGDYNYKVVGNHSYSAYEFPGSNQNQTVSVDQDNSTVTVTFNPATELLEAQVSPPGCMTNCTMLPF